MYVILLLGFVVWLLYKWLTSNHDYFAKQGVPNLEPLPVFGNVSSALFGRESGVDLFTRSYIKFKQSK